jgi:hypothetical protein
VTQIGLQTRAVLLDVVARPEVLGRRRSKVKRREEDDGSMNGSFQCRWSVSRGREGGAVPRLGQ